jgi:hypothetical protein
VSSEDPGLTIVPSWFGVDASTLQRTLFRGLLGAGGVESDQGEQENGFTFLLDARALSTLRRSTVLSRTRRLIETNDALAARNAAHVDEVRRWLDRTRRSLVA